MFFIICALVFECPWKVNLVMIVVLLCATMLPAKYRKCFWIGVGFVFSCLIIWILLPEGHGWEPYQYNLDKEIKLINAKYAVLEKDNAAEIYISILNDYKLKELIPKSVKPDDYIMTQIRPWSSKEYPEIVHWLNTNEDIISQCIKGAFKDNCYFPIRKEDVYFSLLKSKRRHLQGLHILSSMILSSAGNDLGEGWIEDGLLKQGAVLRVSEQLCHQFVIHDMMAGIEMQGSFLNQIQFYAVTQEASNEYLESIEYVLSKIEHNWKEDWDRIAEYEQLDKMNFFCGNLYDQNPKGRIRIKIQNYIIPATVIHMEELPYWPKRAAKAQNILFWFFLPSRPEGLYDTVNSSVAEYALMEEYYTSPGGPRKVPPFEQFKMNFSCYVQWHMNNTVFRMFEKYMRHKVEVQSSRIIVALRRYRNEHGYWPSSLEEIKSLTDEEVFVDAVNGDEFIYKRIGDNFTLYSKGFNGIDDKGRHRRYNFNSGGSDDWQIWPPRFLDIE
ncbi:MAG: hypothetical protein ACYTFM_06360 [Planctomycetota bacterium]|jgi:hypothetical protein